MLNNWVYIIKYVHISIPDMCVFNLAVSRIIDVKSQHKRAEKH